MLFPQEYLLPYNKNKKKITIRERDKKLRTKRNIKVNNKNENGRTS